MKTQTKIICSIAEEDEYFGQHKIEKKNTTHYQRTDVILRGWCGIGLGGKMTDWTIDLKDVTCKRCLVAAEKYKTQDNLPYMSAGWSKGFLPTGISNPLLV